MYIALLIINIYQRFHLKFKWTWMKFNSNVFHVYFTLIIYMIILNMMHMILYYFLLYHISIILL